MRWLLLIGCVGCGSAGTAPLQLSWQFADGRSCADSGAGSVSVKAGGDPVGFHCEDGVVPAAVMIEVSKDGTTVHVDALSPAGAPLYSGSLGLDAVPSAATVTLYANAMR